jgi:hypothetical protein
MIKKNLNDEERRFTAFQAIPFKIMTSLLTSQVWLNTYHLGSSRTKLNVLQNRSFQKTAQEDKENVNLHQAPLVAISTPKSLCKPAIRNRLQNSRFQNPYNKQETSSDFSIQVIILYKTRRILQRDQTFYRLKFTVRERVTFS